MNDIEILHDDSARGRFRSALFDFDGTLSLIREGWPQVMIPMMTGVLRQAGARQGDAELAAHVEEFMMQLNGRQTIEKLPFDVAPGGTLVARPKGADAAKTEFSVTVTVPINAEHAS